MLPRCDRSEERANINAETVGERLIRNLNVNVEQISSFNFACS